jgi:histidine phosphotransferase ChpT
MLTIDPVGEGDNLSFRVVAAGLNARMPQKIAEMLDGTHVGPVESHGVQPYYTRLLAQASGLTVALAPEGDTMVVSAV